jgi:lipoprotein-releasing system permease protein
VFELGLALKYLIPRKKSLSSSFVAAVSALVIALVVWLVLVFFSVTQAMESGWLNKITAFSGSFRIQPNEAYYSSYYYQSDAFARASNYTHKTLGQKLDAIQVDPLDPNVDEALTSPTLIYDTDESGKTRDLVKELKRTLDPLKKKIQLSEMHVAGGSLKLRCVRPDPKSAFGEKTQCFLSTVPYYYALDSENTRMGKAVLPVRAEDVTTLMHSLCQTNATTMNEGYTRESKANNREIESNLKRLFDWISIEVLELDMPLSVPKTALPKSGSLQAFKEVSSKGRVRYFLIKPKKITATEELLDCSSLPKQAQFFLPAKTPIKCFQLEVKGPNLNITFNTLSRPLLIDPEHIHASAVKITSPKEPSSALPPFWIQVRDNGSCFLPSEVATLGTPILVPKAFQEKGVAIGDVGFISYTDTQLTGAHEQRQKTFVAGFYDPGLSPLAGRLILASPKLVSVIASSSAQIEFDKTMGNAFIGWTLKPQDAINLKSEIITRLKEAKLDTYFEYEPYTEFEFTRPFILQFQSDRMLFVLIASLILGVACCNVISFLVLLVQSKRKEIAVLASMGASNLSIVKIFCLTGGLLGLFASIVGSIAAWITVKNLDSIIKALSFLEAHPAFSSDGFGVSHAISLSPQGLATALIIVPLLATIGGALAARSALRQSPSEILRSP